MNTAAIAQHLNIAESAIIRIEEWANALFVVCYRLGARFVSKKIVKMKVKMEFTARGTVWVKEKPVVEIEGNFYDISKADCRKIVEIRQSQGYKELKEALHGAEFNFKIVRGINKASLVLPPAKPVVKNDEDADADKLYRWLLSGRAVSDSQLPNEI